MVCTDEAKPNLYLVTIGTSEYKDERFNLNYAAKDARDLAAIFEGSNTTYDNVYTKTITNDEAVIDNITSLKSFFDQAGIDDVVMVLLPDMGY